jgi:hypothetical protein
MTDPATAALSAAHLIRAVVPTATAPEPALRLSLERVDAAITLSDAVRLRLPFFPPPVRQETLAELVQAARRRLREDRVRVEASELGARRVVLDSVLRGLVP